MERTMWTDERLDDRFNSIDRNFEEVRADIREVRADLRGLRTLIFGLWGTNMLVVLVTLVAVLVTRT